MDSFVFVFTTTVREPDEGCLYPTFGPNIRTGFDHVPEGCIEEVKITP
jgi:hypothetical protein